MKRFRSSNFTVGCVRFEEAHRFANSLYIWEKLERFLYGKRVCLVGGGEADETFIREADAVVRLNNHVRSADDITHIWYHGNSIHVDPKIICVAAPQFVIVNISQTKMPRFMSDIWDKPEKSAAWAPTVMFVTHDTFMEDSPLGILHEWSNILGKRLNTIPLTGIYACELLSLFPLKQLMMTGFSFYQQPDGSIPVNISSHQLGPQIKWLREKWEFDSRICCDETLERILIGYDEPFNFIHRAGVGSKFIQALRNES